MTKQEQIEYVKKCWTNIGYIENPDKDIQLAAIRQSEYSIQLIKNPDPEIIRLVKIKERLNKL